MKADHRKALEKNELASKLTQAWEGVASTSPKANRTWVVLLGAFIMAVAWYLYSSYSANRDASMWGNLDFAGDVKSLQKIIEEAPGTMQAQIARFHIARTNLQDATGKIAAQASDERAAAADSLETVRKTYGELVGVSGLPSILTEEAMLERAKVEEILASVPKADAPTSMRGSLDQAIKYYSELATRYAKSYAGEQAAKRAEYLKTNKAEIEKLYAELAKDHAKTPPEPAFPSLPPLTPSGSK
jgi:hypothetical protein